MEWFSVDKKGLADIVARRGKRFILFELLQNAFDCPGTRRVEVDIEPLPGPYARLTITDDDPQGFANLAHAWTLFAPSAKKDDPTRRGRFNLGEKLVLALCKEAEIVSVTGGVRFDETGRHALRRRRETGSEFTGVIRITREEIQDLRSAALTVIPPKNVVVRVGDILLDSWRPLGQTSAELVTEIANADGVLTRTIRQTEIRIYPLSQIPGCKAGWIYELGIPVCETGDSFHVDIGQKIPLNMERDGVTPAFLRAVRTIVLNAMHPKLDEEEARKPWVQAALEGKHVTAEAVARVVALQHGPRAVSYDPSDREGTMKAASQGYTVVAGGTYSRDAWENIRHAGALPPAGRVTPARIKNFADATFLSDREITSAMRRFRLLVQNLAEEILDVPASLVEVVFLRSPDATTLADYSKDGNVRRVRFNVSNLGEAWFDGPISERHLDLIIHELAHEGGHHLEAGYHDLMSAAGAKIAILALNCPEMFDLGESSR